MNIFIEVLKGLLIGYIVLSISESASHNYFLHGSRKIRNFWKRIGKVGNYILNSWYSHHVVHHYRTFKKNHVTQFNSKEEEIKLTENLTEMGKNQIALNSFGLRVGSPKEWVKYSYPHLPHYFLICYFGGFWFSIGALLPLFFYEWLAHFAHPYIHMPYKKALEKSSPAMRLFLHTPYFKFLAQHHYLHHRYIDCNFNLLLGGDIIWRKQKYPNFEDIIEMKKLGLYVRQKKLIKHNII